MKSKTTNIRHMLILAALSSTLISTSVMAESKANGKVGAKNNGDGTSTIRIVDPDKIKWYTVYDKNPKSGTWEPVDGFNNVQEGCKKTIVNIELDKSHLNHDHLVKYGDCLNPSKIETWTDVFHALWLENFRPGQRFIYETAVQSLKEDNSTKKQVDYKIEDVNNDNIPDLVVTRNNDSAVGVAVMKGNGDGSFQQPSIETGTMIIIPQGN